MSANPDSERYELYYWPNIQGRGELIRLAFEATRTPYLDVARLPAERGGGAAAIMPFLKGERPGHLPLAPPFLKCGDLVLAQTAAILEFLGPRLGLVPKDEPGRWLLHQLELTILDFIQEAHDTHHPIATSLYYEDQRAEAERRSRLFLRERVPKFSSYFERVLERRTRTNGPLLNGDQLSYVDLSLFQVMEGLRYAFPRAMARSAPPCPRLRDLADWVRAEPNVAAYLSSERRLPFTESGIFRHYPELDVLE